MATEAAPHADEIAAAVGSLSDVLSALAAAHEQATIARNLTQRALETAQGGAFAENDLAELSEGLDALENYADAVQAFLNRYGIGA